MTQSSILLPRVGAAGWRPLNESNDEALIPRIEGTVAARSLWADTAATSANLASGANVAAIQLGSGATTVTIPGNLAINGTVTTVNTTNLSISDNLIYGNAGGADPSFCGIAWDQGAALDVIQVYNPTDNRVEIGRFNTGGGITAPATALTTLEDLRIKNLLLTGAQITGNTGLVVDSGGAGNVVIRSVGASVELGSGAGGATRWLVDAAGPGNFLSPTNANIGEVTQANSPTTIYAATSVVVGTTVTVTTNAVTGSAALTVDAASALNLGTATATSVVIGRPGITTDFPAGQTVDFTGAIVTGLATGTLQDAYDASSPATITTNGTTGALTIGGDQAVTLSTTGKVDIPGTGANTVRIGTTNTIGDAGDVAIGALSNATGGFGVAIGYQARSLSSYGVAVGNDAQAQAQSVAIGRLTNATGGSSIAIGSGSDATGNNAICIGVGNSVVAGNFAIGIGVGVSGVSTGDVHLGTNVGSLTGDSQRYYLGPGKTRNATSRPANIFVYTSSGTGTDDTATSLVLSSGAGTGAGTATSLSIQTPTPGVSGTTPQSYVTRATFTDASIAIGNDASHTGTVVLGNGSNTVDFPAGTTVDFTGASVTGLPVATLSSVLSAGNTAGSNGGIVFDGATTADRTIKGQDGAGTGASLDLTGGAASSGAGVAGTLNLRGGAATSGDGGSVVIQGGVGNASATGASATFGGGNSSFPAPAGDCSISGGNGGVNSSRGGNVAISGGLADGTSGNVGGSVSLNGGGGVNGPGGSVLLSSGGGAGGTGTYSGGSVAVTTGGGGARIINGTSGSGGTFSVACGVGGVASSNVGAGTGGAAVTTAGTGGNAAQLGVGDGGAGGAVAFTAGTGGLGAATKVGGVGGAATLAGGAGGNINGGTSAGDGGTASLTGGQGGDVTGDGGSILITSGAGGSTSGNSGNVTIDVGAVTSGTRGTITIGSSGVTTDFPSGSTVDFTGANVTGLPAPSFSTVTETLTNGNASPVTIGQVAYMTTTADTVDLADATSNVLASNALCFVQDASITNGVSGSYVTGGTATVRLVGSLTLNPGDTIYLSTTAGSCTNVAPSTTGNVILPLGFIKDTLTYDGATDFLVEVILQRGNRSIAP